MVLLLLVRLVARVSDSATARTARRDCYIQSDGVAIRAAGGAAPSTAVGTPSLRELRPPRPRRLARASAYSGCAVRLSQKKSKSSQATVYTPLRLYSAQLGTGGGEPYLYTSTLSATHPSEKLVAASSMSPIPLVVICISADTHGGGGRTRGHSAFQRSGRHPTWRSERCGSTHSWQSCTRRAQAPYRPRSPRRQA
jgi:hypothetical protein